MTIVNVLPAIAHLEVPARSDFSLTFQLAEEDGTPINLTNESVRLDVWKSRRGTVALSQENAPGEHLDPGTGQTTFSFVPEDLDVTSSSKKTWFYTVWRIYDSGNKERPWFQGEIRIHPVMGNTS